MSRQWLSVGHFCGLVGLRTFRRRPQSMRRISTVSAERGLQAWTVSRSQSLASCSWYSSSQADLMLISRKRANSLGVAEPHPSTMLNAMDSAAPSVWDFSDPRSFRGNLRMARRTFNTCSCALCHTKSRRKSCILAFCSQTREPHRQFPAVPPEFLRHRQLATTEYSRTHQLRTQNLHPLRPTSDSPMRDSTRIR